MEEIRSRRNEDETENWRRERMGEKADQQRVKAGQGSKRRAVHGKSVADKILEMRMFNIYCF